MTQRKTPLLLTAGLLVTTSLSAAEAGSVEDRLKKLEDRLDQAMQENSELKKQLGYDGKSNLVVAKPAGKEAKMNIGGFVHLQAEAGDAPDARFSSIEDRFLIRRARLNVTGSFLEHFDYRFETDLSGNTLGESSGIRLQATDIFVNWTRYSFATVRAGQFKVPFGFEQLAADTKWPAIERSFANDRITEPRQIGVGLMGGVLDSRVSYNFGVFNGASANTSFNDNEAFMAAGRIQGVPLKTKWREQDIQWSIGVNALTTSDDGSTGPANVTKTGFGLDSIAGGAEDNVLVGERSAWGVDTQLRFGPFELLAEYLQAQFEPDNAVPQSWFAGDGWYVMGTCYVLPNKLQALARFESFDPNRSVNGNTTDVWTFGLNYYVKGDDIKLMANYMWGDNAFEKDDQGRFLLRLQLMF